VISFLIPIILGFFIEPLILVIFTEKYASVVPYCQLYLYVIPFYIIFEFLINYLVKYNMNKEIIISKLLAIIVTIFMYIILIPLFEINGAIIGSIAFFIIQDYPIFQLWKKIKVNGCKKVGKKICDI